MNKEVITEIDLLIDTIKKSDIYKEYILLLEKIKNSKEINDLTNEIRVLNKKMVLTPSIEIENELKAKEKELNEIPLYLEYKYKLDELNNMLLVVKNKIELFMKDILVN